MKLKRLILTGALFSDQCLQDVSRMKTLKDFELHPRQPHFMTEGIKAISTMVLATLRLSGVSVSDEDARSLGKMSSLRKLSINNSGLTESGYRSLRQTLPSCRIVIEDYR